MAYIVKYVTLSGLTKTVKFVFINISLRLPSSKCEHCFGLIKCNCVLFTQIVVYPKCVMLIKTIFFIMVMDMVHR